MTNAVTDASMKKGGAPVSARPSIQDLTMLKIDHLAAFLKRGETEVFTTTISVTPDMAKRLLERNVDNRPVRWKGPSRTVEAYADAMMRGEWQLNGETVIVSSDGWLNDGQHRLHAVIASDISVPMQITFGVDRDSRHTVDQGGARTPGNILAMYGEKNTNHLAHALQFVWCYDDRRVFGYRPSPEQLLATLDTNPRLREALHSVSPLWREFRLSSGYVGGAYYVCMRANETVADEFLSGAITGLNISDANSPIIRLRKRYQEHASKRENLPALEQAALFVKAFNAFRRHQSIRNLIWRRNGPAAEEFPVVGA